MEHRDTDVNSKNNFEQTPLHLAAQNGDVFIVRLSLMQGADANSRNLLWETPLHLAVKHRHIGIVSLLVGLGADTSSPNASGETPLQLAGAASALELIYHSC